MGRKKKKQQVGFAYFMGIAYSLCSKIDSLVSFMIDDKKMCDDNPVPNGTGVFTAKTGIESEQYPSGNPYSRVHCYNGEQVIPDAYLTAKTGVPIAYRNTAYLVINGFIGDNVRSAPNYSVVAKRVKLGMLENREHEDINGSANPAAVLKYIFVKMLGLSEDALDAKSFDECGQALFNEPLGISFVMSESKEAKDWIEEILRTIDGALALDKSTGKIKMRLLRGDYKADSLALIDESKASGIKFVRKGWESCYSTLVVKFTDADKHEENSISFMNPATREILGYDKNFKTSFMMIRDEKSLNGVLNRLVKKMCYPWASLRFSVSINDYPNLMVGDVYRFSNEKLGIYNMPIRIMGLGGDKEESGKIEVEATEDMYSLQIDKQVTQIGAAKAQSNDNYALIQNDIIIGAIKAPAELDELRGVYPLCAYPDGLAERAYCQDGSTGEKAVLDNSAVGILLDYIPVGQSVDLYTTFKIEQISKLWAVKATRAGWQRLKMSVAIDDEVMGYEFRKDLGGGKWQIGGLIRGIAGTPIQAHSKGAKVWFAPVDVNEIQTLSCVSLNPTLRFVLSNSRGQIEKTLKIELNDDNYKPYAPSNLQASRNGEKVSLKWRNRIKLGGANYRNIDTIPAGADEGRIDGYVVIEWSDEGGAKTATSTGGSITLNAPAGTKFSIYAIGEHGLAYPSDKISVVA